MQQKIIAISLGAIAFLITTIGGLYIITYREQVTVLVKDKYWHYYLDVRYDEQHTRTVLKTRESCTGFGKDKKCSTDSYLDTERYTDTHIVCKGEREGKELPPLRPELTCEKTGNQYEAQEISYHLVFDEKNSQKDVTFPGDLWGRLLVGKWNKVERDFFGKITAYVGE